jgi:hypothetical protein
VNLIHCCPPELPENVFKHLSPLTEEGRNLLDSNEGWIVAYGAFLDDEGNYKSQADRLVSRLVTSGCFFSAFIVPMLTGTQFDNTHIRAKHPSLGLRSIKSITLQAEKWGFVESARQDLAKGNMFIVWRPRCDTP